MSLDGLRRGARLLADAMRMKSNRTGQRERKFHPWTGGMGKSEISGFCAAMPVSPEFDAANLRQLQPKKCAELKS